MPRIFERSGNRCVAEFQFLKQRPALQARFQTRCPMFLPLNKLDGGEAGLVSKACEIEGQ